MPAPKRTLLCSPKDGKTREMDRRGVGNALALPTEEEWPQASARAARESEAEAQAPDAGGEAGGRSVLARQYEPGFLPLQGVDGPGHGPQDEISFRPSRQS